MPFLGFSLSYSYPIPPLDQIAGMATGAYSTRLVNSNFKGSLLRVRRSSDNSEQDIGFVSNDLNTLALTSFVGGGDGFLTKWYDQSGSARDFIQATAAAQPKIVSAGSIITTINGKPTVLFDGVDDQMTNSTTVANMATASAWSALALMRVTLAPAAFAGAGYGGNNLLGDTSGFWYPLSDGDAAGIKKIGIGQFTAGGDFQALNTLTLNSALVQAGKYDGTNLKSWVNGGTAASTASGNISTTTGTMRMGASYNAGVFYNGYSSEILLFNTALPAAALNTLGPNMAARAGTSWSAVT